MLFSKEYLAARCYKRGETKNKKSVKFDNEIQYQRGHRSKSMKPRSTSTCDRRTRTRSPTSSPFSPLTTFPSIGGEITRTNVPFDEAPVTSASNSSPTRLATTSAAADFLICRSTLFAASSCVVQCVASRSSSLSA